MKNKLLIAVLVMAMTPFAAFSQLDIVPTYGYNFGAKYSSPYSTIKMKGNSTYGVNLDFNLDEHVAIQFIYTNTSSYINIDDYYDSYSGKLCDVKSNYFLLGGMSYFMDGNIQPYGSFGVGAAYFSFSDIEDSYGGSGNVNQTDKTYFAIGFGLGAKFMFTERIGLDVHVRCLAPITWGGVGVGVGTGGASAGAYAGSSFVSGDVGGGLVIRLGN